MTTDITRVNQRVLGQACVDRRLAELKALLDRAAPDGRIERPADISQPARYGMEASRWDAALNSGRVSLFGANEQAGFGFIYVSLSYFYEMENGEQLVWARLHALEGGDRLTADGLLTMRSTLEEARFYNSSIRQVGPIILDRAGKLDLKPTSRIDPPAICRPMTARPAPKD